MEIGKLLLMSYEQVKGSFLNKKLRVILNDGQEEEFIVEKLSLTRYTNIEPYAVVGFISQSGKSYSFQVIKEIYAVTT